MTTLITCTLCLCPTAASLVERGHGAQRVRPLRQEEERKEGEKRKERKEGEEVKRRASPSPLFPPAPDPPPHPQPFCLTVDFVVLLLPRYVICCLSKLSVMKCVQGNPTVALSGFGMGGLGLTLCVITSSQHWD